jgi:ABC-type bacteriocin/lantibiotic exporter with double-glycine peptidase domain
MQNSNNISGGQLQRLGVARCLYRDPKVIILDEATTGLSFELESDIISRVIEMKRERIIIIISHSEHIIQKCDVVVKLRPLESAL